MSSEAVPSGSVVAYFSMEIALDPAMPTYAGGLGVLAGDTVRSCADLGVPMVAVTLLHRRGYFHQRLDAEGRQTEEPVDWAIEQFAEPVEPRVTIQIEGRPVRVAAWRHVTRGVTGAEVPCYLLDTDLPENAPGDRHLTDTLYGGDARYRLCQEALLGLGGLEMLRRIGYRRIERCHLNEGHAALVALALEEELERAGMTDPAARIEEVRRRCAFTTHTPVPAGHDKFPQTLAKAVLGEERTARLALFDQRAMINMTDLALRGSRFVNGVAMRHGEVSRGMFAGYPIRSITNGIHPVTWAAPPFRALFDRHIRGWRQDALSLRYAVGIPARDIWWAHNRCKRLLLREVNRLTDAGFDLESLTIGFARRAAAYKRATLPFHDVERLALIAQEAGPIQLVLAGKAHPEDYEGKAMIRRVFEAREKLGGRIRLAYLSDYDMRLACRMVAGCDLWLNCPVPPLEASGTSGMKAALNGVPSLSILDGWWLEGHVEGVTGWAIGGDDGHLSRPPAERDHADADALYEKLRSEVIPCFYEQPQRYVQIMRYAIALNASFFNTQRMVLQYLYGAYLAETLPTIGPPAEP